MRLLCALVGVCAAFVPSRADDRAWPLVEQYLHKGEFARGEQALEKELAARPADDQVRFGLGVLRLVRGVERMGQSFYEYGLKSENAHSPFVRFPVPQNPNPSTIRFSIFRRILDDFYRDLDVAERTLADVKDEKVKLPLRLAKIRLDLDGDGKATDTLADVLKRLMRQDTFSWEKGNSEFLVCFDRGDVAWLRAYCHLLMAMLDGYLAIETEAWFNIWAGELFAKPAAGQNLTTAERRQKTEESMDALGLKEPGRLGRFRQHLLKMIALNRETWKYVRAETDDDHEWLPNPKQTGVLGLPVREGMIDAWLDMLNELEAILEGKSVFISLLGRGTDEGLNLRILLDDPPGKVKSIQDLDRKYFTKGPDVNLNVIGRLFQVFDHSMAMGYMLWFN